MGKKVVEMPGGERPSVISSDPAPRWTLSAANRFDILAMAAIVGMAEQLEYVDREHLVEMRETLREFEMYEARHR